LRKLIEAERPELSNLGSAARRVLAAVSRRTGEPAVTAYLESLAGVTEVLVFRCFSLEPPGPVTRLLRVAPPHGTVSVRCWDGPGRLRGIHDGLLRLQAGDAVRIIDRFEVEGELWVQTDFVGCWTPRRFLEWGVRDDFTELNRDSPLMRWEFDVAMEELESETAARLRAAGMLEFFDPVAGVITAALTFRRFVPSDVEILMQARSGTDSNLDQAVHNALRVILDGLGGDPELEEILEGAD
jgi:hypothetical protein